MPPPTIKVIATGERPSFDVRRGPGVPDAFWLRLRSEWGIQGPDPSAHLFVGVEQVLSRLAWLKPACLAHGVGVEWDDRARKTIESLHRERLAVGETATKPPLTDECHSDKRRAGDVRRVCGANILRVARSKTL